MGLSKLLVVSALGLSVVAGASLVMTAPALAGGSSCSVKSEKQNIVQTAVAAGQFGTLAKAIEAAGLVDALSGEGPFTVFAPTDEAFAKLPAGTVENLLKPENREQLQAVLKYHVVSGKIKSKNIESSASPETLQGAKLDVQSQDGKVTVNGANVIKADVYASNGVIHAIDTVLLPPTEAAASAE